MRHETWLTMLALGLMLTACGGSNGSEDGSAADEASSDSGPATESASEEDRPTIRDFDFTTVTWREAVSQRELATGEGDHGEQRSIGDIAYADVNQDGEEDALVGLVTEDGNGYEQVFYIWTWDPEGEAAVQVENPIARESRCGDSVEEISGADGAFVIRERVGYVDLDRPDCASPPPMEVTRKVALEDNWPVLAMGQGGHGGICPQFNGTDDLWPLEELAVHPGPRESTGTLDPEFVQMFAEVDVWQHLWLFRENWMLVHLTPQIRGEDDGFAEYGDYVPCGWLFLEEDTRPIPH